MRIVLIGASSLAVTTARMLLKRGNEVVIIDRDRERIDALNEDLDCGFLHGDGSKPALLADADPANTDALLCLTNHDQTNIIASLVGRSQGYKRVITKIVDPDFQHICLELGLEDTIIPDSATALHLVNNLRGTDMVELSGILKDDARLLFVVAREEDAGPIGELKLPSDARVVCLYRDDRFVPVQDDTKVRTRDELVLITREKQLEDLKERWRED